MLGLKKENFKRQDYCLKGIHMIKTILVSSIHVVTVMLYWIMNKFIYLNYFLNRYFPLFCVNPAIKNDLKNKFKKTSNVISEFAST